MFLTYYYQKVGLQANSFLQATSGEWSIDDIGLIVKANKEIIPSILAGHAPSYMGRHCGSISWCRKRYYCKKNLEWEKN